MSVRRIIRRRAIILASFSALTLPCNLAAAQVPAEEGDEAQDAQDPEQEAITITGEREERPNEAPTGSRIAGGERDIGFQTISSRTGVAGLLPGSGMDPFAGGTKYIRRTQCRSRDARLTSEGACRLHLVQQQLEAGELDEARFSIDRFLNSEGITDEERYAAATLWYRVGEAARDPLTREDALTLMLSSDAMPEQERPAALRTLVSLALARNDAVAAVARLERLVSVAPGDARSRANLASFYAAAGRREAAVRLIEEAISITRARGETVPEDWLAFNRSAAGE